MTNLKKRKEIKTLRNNKIKTKIEKEQIIKTLKKEINELNQTNKLEIKKIRLYLKSKFKKETKTKKEFNIGLSDEDKRTYKKRANVEHPYKFLKTHRINTVKWKTKSMFINEIYNSLIDFIIFRERNKIKLQE